MGLITEGHGFSIAQAGVSLTQEPVTVEIPGFTQAELERTVQGNTSVKTGRVAKLKKYENFTHQFPYDPTDYALLAAQDGSGLHTITFPSGGTFKVYAEVLSIGNISQETDGRPVYDVTFMCTNLNGDIETAPVYAGS